MKSLYESILGSTESGGFRFSDIKQVEFYSDEEDRYKQVFNSTMLKAYTRIKHNYRGKSYPQMYWYILCDITNTGKTYSEAKEWITRIAKNSKYVNDSNEIDTWLQKLTGKFIKTISNDVRFFVNIENGWIKLTANYDSWYNCQILRFKF